MAINLYIDESGSMTNNYASYKSFFIISIIKVKNEKILARNLKRFISDNFKTLRKIDSNNKMFINDKFHELKGSELNAELKIKFIKEICRNNCLEIFYIKLLNSKVDEKLFNNKARAFNYLLKIFLSHAFHKGYLTDEDINLQIDERNVKTQAKYSLADYLNTELILGEDLLTNPLTVKYFDSSNNKFIQVADVFSNFYFSHCMTNKYSDILENLQEEGYLKEIFVFPPNYKKNKKV